MNKKDGLSGSFTVEAAIVLPIVIYILLLVVYISFYLYSNYALALHAYISAFRGSRSSVAEAGYAVTEESMQFFLQEELPAVGEIKHNIYTSMWKTQVEIKGKSRIPFWERWIERFAPIHISSYAQRIEPVSFIRNCRRLEAAFMEE